MKVRMFRWEDPEDTIEVQEVGERRTWEFYWDRQGNPDFGWEEVSDDYAES